jgi:hypothetical protein
LGKCVIEGLGRWASGDRDKGASSAGTGGGVEDDDIRRGTG